MSIGDLPPLPELPGLPKLPSLDDVMRAVRTRGKDPQPSLKRSVLDKSEVIISLDQELVPKIEEINPDLKPYLIHIGQSKRSGVNYTVDFLSGVYSQIPSIQEISVRYPNARLNFFYEPKPEMGFFGKKVNLTDLVDGFMSNYLKDIGNRRLFLIVPNEGSYLSNYQDLIKNGIGIGD